jgi:hypothetical protein
MFPTVEATENSHKKAGKKRSLTHTKALSGSPPPHFGGRRARQQDHLDREKQTRNQCQQQWQ